MKQPGLECLEIIDALSTYIENVGSGARNKLQFDKSTDQLLISKTGQIWVARLYSTALKIVFLSKHSAIEPQKINFCVSPWDGVSSTFFYVKSTEKLSSKGYLKFRWQTGTQFFCAFSWKKVCLACYPMVLNLSFLFDRVHSDFWGSVALCF